MTVKIGTVKIGGVYTNRCGRTVTITGSDKRRRRCPFTDGSSYYSESGKNYIHVGKGYASIYYGDLIEEVINQ